MAAGYMPIATVIDITGEDRMQEAVADKGYCKLETLSDGADRDLATSFSKPKVNGQRRWDDKPDAGRSALDANHEHVTSDLCETGGSRRATVRGMTKVTAWYPLRATAHNLSLIGRTLLGLGQPRDFSAALQSV